MSEPSVCIHFHSTFLCHYTQHNQPQETGVSACWLCLPELLS